MTDLVEVLFFLLDPSNNLGPKAILFSTLIIVILKLIPNLNLVESLAARIQSWLRDRTNAELNRELKIARSELDELELRHSQELERYEVELSQTVQLYPYQLLTTVLGRVLDLLDTCLEDNSELGHLKELLHNATELRLKELERSKKLGDT